MAKQHQIYDILIKGEGTQALSKLSKKYFFTAPFWQYIEFEKYKREMMIPNGTGLFARNNFWKNRAYKDEKLLDSERLGHDS